MAKENQNKAVEEMKMERGRPRKGKKIRR